MLHLKGVGIDILESSRIKKLIADHSPKKCARLLTRSELKHWRKEKYSTTSLCRFIAAKEAFFKALGGLWMGPDGFRSFEVKKLSGRWFQIQSSNDSTGGRNQSKGFFFHSGKWVGAHVALWEPDLASAVR